jgi:uncharacterized protein (TIGR02646 family)
MMKIERLPIPQCLRDRSERWTNNYLRRRETNPVAQFKWNEYQRIRVNLLLLPDLKLMTAEHCSFCDGFPIETVGDSIEHFRPKESFPHLAYDWDNLFYACRKCQESKLTQFDEKLLKPDATEYLFEYYFQYDTATGKILPNSDRLPDKRERANITIKLYGLNEHGRPRARKRTIRQFIDSGQPVLDDFPFRFILRVVQS